MKQFKPVLFCLLIIYSILPFQIGEKSFAGLNDTAATSVLDKILERQIIKVGITADYMPFSYINQNGGNAGIDIKLAENLAESLNVKLEFVKTSWPTLMDDLLQNKFDIAMSGISITLERQKSAMFSIPLHIGGKAAICRDEDVQKYKTLEQINNPNVKVIFNPGGTNELFARENFPKANLILNEDNITIFEKLVTKEADVMVTDAIETIIQQKLHPELEAVNPDKPFNYSEKGFLFKRDYVFKAYIDQWINLRLKDGTYQEIYDDQLNKLVKNNSK